jgi:hypothetical protein
MKMMEPNEKPERDLDRFMFVAGLTTMILALAIFAMAYQRERAAMHWMEIAHAAQYSGYQTTLSDGCENTEPTPVLAPPLEGPTEFSIVEPLPDECFPPRPDGHATDGCHCPHCRTLERLSRGKVSKCDNCKELDKTLQDSLSR